MTQQKKDLETPTPSSVLIYTKFERNTGGDQQLLNMVSNQLIENLEKDSTIDLFLAYDTLSEKRAENTAKEWLSKYPDKKITIWGHKSQQAGTRLKSNIKGPITYLGTTGEDKPITNEKELNADSEGKLFYDYIKNKNPDTIVIGGWSHLLDGQDAEHLSNRILQKDASGKKVLLCSPPGAYVNYSAFKEKLEFECTEKGYILHCFQPGIYTKAGLPIPTKLSTDDIGKSACREKWIEHLKDQLPEEDFAKLSTESNPEPKKDNLIVIYCSKDGPGASKGEDFLKKVTNEIKRRKEEIEDYNVLLVGTNVTTSEFKQWEGKCSQAGFKSVVPVERTKSSDVLMRGLRDAKFSMATGSFTILEAKALGINHCEYLCPPHLTDFGKLLVNASQQELEAAFERGKQSLADLGQLKLNPTTLAADTALKNCAEEIAMKPDLAEQHYQEQAKFHNELGTQYSQFAKAYLKTDTERSACCQKLSELHHQEAEIDKTQAVLHKEQNLLKQQAAVIEIEKSGCERKLAELLSVKNSKSPQLVKLTKELNKLKNEKDSLTTEIKIEKLKLKTNAPSDKDNKKQIGQKEKDSLTTEIEELKTDAPSDKDEKTIAMQIGKKESSLKRLQKSIQDKENAIEKCKDESSQTHEKILKNEEEKKIIFAREKTLHLQEAELSLKLLELTKRQEEITEEQKKESDKLRKANNVNKEHEEQADFYEKKGSIYKELRAIHQEEISLHDKFKDSSELTADDTKVDETKDLTTRQAQFNERKTEQHQAMQTTSSFRIQMNEMKNPNTSNEDNSELEYKSPTKQI